MGGRGKDQPRLLPAGGRSDLKRFVLGLVCNQHGMPVYMQSFNGNESDRKSLLEMITRLKTELSSTGKVYHVADSAFPRARISRPFANALTG
jgi:transposase